MYIQAMYIHRSVSQPMQPRKSLQSDARTLLEVCAGWNSRVAARRITQFLDRKMEGHGLSVTQLGLMAQIAAASDDTLGVLAQRTGLEQSSLSRSLRRLEAEGLIGNRRCRGRSAPPNSVADRNGCAAVGSRIGRQVEPISPTCHVVSDIVRTRGVLQLAFDGLSC